MSRDVFCSFWRHSFDELAVVIVCSVSWWSKRCQFSRKCIWKPPVSTSRLGSTGENHVGNCSYAPNNDVFAFKTTLARFSLSGFSLLEFRFTSFFCVTSVFSFLFQVLYVAYILYVTGYYICLHNAATAALCVTDRADIQPIGYAVQACTPPVFPEGRMSDQIGVSLCLLC